MPEIRRHDKQVNLSPQKIKSIQASMSDNSKSLRQKRQADHNTSQGSSAEKRIRKRKSVARHDINMVRFFRYSFLNELPAE